MDFLRIWTDQDARRGVAINSKRVKMVSSSASLHEGINGVQRSKKTSGSSLELGAKAWFNEGGNVEFSAYSVYCFNENAINIWQHLLVKEVE